MERVCSKHPYYTRKLVQGLLTVLCSGCGGCVGYEVMKYGETPAMMFKWVLRHREEAPAAIIYDNACNLAKYCMVREPIFFRHTRFVVDRFHQFSHKHCAPCFDADNYSFLHNVNTQLVE